MPKKIIIGVVFSGRSSEHEISILSANSIINGLDKRKYDIIPLYINKKGEFYNKKFYWPKTKKISLTKKYSKPTGTLFNKSNKKIFKNIDVVFPAIHGAQGEDGVIQGFLEMLNIPYIGSGIIGSALGINKILQKKIWQQEGLPIIPYLNFLYGYFLKNPKKIINKLANINIKPPFFIKPARSGSSIGISKAKTKKQILAGIKLAGKYDEQIIIEQAIDGAKEIEVGILGNRHLQASVPGQIIPKNEFYDYKAKYIDKSKIKIPASLPQKISKKIRQIAKKAFLSLQCQVMARVDFLIRKNKIYLLEINTIPGFTPTSIYPKLWEKSGIKYNQLLNKLIQLAISRHNKK